MMKVIALFVTLIVAANAGRLPRQAAVAPTQPPIDVTGIFINQLKRTQHQVASMSSVIETFNRSVQGMVTHGLRVVSGQDSASSQPQPPTDLSGTAMILGQFQQISNQLTTMTSLMRQLNEWSRSVFNTGVRLVSGLQSVPTVPTDVGLVGHTAQSINSLVAQLSTLQRGIIEVTQQLTRMVQTGTRMVGGGAAAVESRITSGLQAPNPSSDNGVDGLVSGISGITNSLVAQLSTLQRGLTDVMTQMTRIVQSATRMIGGSGPLPASHRSPSDRFLLGQNSETGSATSITDAAIQRFRALAEQLQTLQSALSRMSSELNQRIGSGWSRLVSGQSAGGAPGVPSGLPENPAPIESLLHTLQSFLLQAQAAQRILVDMSRQINQLVQTSTRFVGGQSAEGAPGVPSGLPENPAPIESVLHTFQQLLTQALAAQRVLVDMNRQINQLVQTGTRFVGGQSAETGNAGNDNRSSLEQVTTTTIQLAGIERVLGELTNQINRMMANGSRVVTGR